MPPSRRKPIGTKITRVFSPSAAPLYGPETRLTAFGDMVDRWMDATQQHYSYFFCCCRLWITCGKRDRLVTVLGWRGLIVDVDSAELVSAVVHREDAVSDGRAQGDELTPECFTDPPYPSLEADPAVEIDAADIVSRSV